MMLLIWNVFHDTDWDNKGRGKPGWWKEQFLNADKDGNGSLDSTEFRE